MNFEPENLGLLMPGAKIDHGRYTMSVSEATRRLGLKIGQVADLCETGELKAILPPRGKGGNRYTWIDPESVRKYKSRS